MKKVFLLFPWFLVLFLGGILIFQERFSTPHGTSLLIQPTAKNFATTLPRTEPRGDTLFLVTRVIDGDTIEIEGGKRVRYIGMDTPEGVTCMAAAATGKNKEWVLGKKVRLEKDVSEVDRYGRLLRYIWVDDKLAGEELVREGLAKVSTFPPDVKYVERFLAAERGARENKRGLWSSNACANPATQQLNNNQTSSDTCLIKGNIATSGERIYHLPGCGSYDKTIISEDAGERWFCTEDEAVAAGWRKAKNCP